jgi:glycosyltransferase involved in cell wall biosynthesis
LSPCPANRAPPVIASEAKQSIFFRIAIILPPREVFSPVSAGAISLVVQRLAAATPGTVVVGRHAGKTFPNIPYHGAKNTLALIRTLRRLNPEYIDIHQQPRLAFMLSYLFPRTRIMLFLHNDPITMRGLKTRLARRLVQARLHRIVTVSAYLQSRFSTGIAPAVLPNPLTLADLPPPAAKEQKILFAGRIVTDKAPDDFVSACAIALPSLPGWSAQMLGGDRFGPNSPETPYVKKIREAAMEAGITFAGPRPHAEVMDAMAKASIVVVPSRWPEPFGLTALEAIASGAALITTGSGGLAEIAGDAAVYVPPNDPTALAAAIIALANDEPRRAALAAAGRARAQYFDTQRIAAALETLRQTV